MDLDDRMFLIGAVLGLILMAASFVAYVITPQTGYTAIFIVGLLLLIGGYVLSFMGNRRNIKAYWAASDEQEANGLFLILDVDYVPFEDGAVIEDLRDM